MRLCCRNTSAALGNDQTQPVSLIDRFESINRESPLNEVVLPQSA
jgi:hypothetical protein